MSRVSGHFGGSLALKPTITGAQLRAARALLSWSARELASRCGVSHSAISRAERVDGRPLMQERNLNAIRVTFEKHGVEFLDGNGIRLLRSLDKDPPKRKEIRE
ncbi:MAG: helix-turn-helix transcriptional regulator [Pseudolabrys sp.]